MKEESDTDKILRAIVEVHEKIATIHETMATKADMDKGFAEVNRPLDKIVQPQLDDHVRRIKKLEEEVFPH